MALGIGFWMRYLQKSYASGEGEGKGETVEKLWVFIGSGLSLIHI